MRFGCSREVSKFRYLDRYLLLELLISAHYYLHASFAMSSLLLPLAVEEAMENDDLIEKVW